MTAQFEGFLCSYTRGMESLTSISGGTEVGVVNEMTKQALRVLWQYTLSLVLGI